MHIKKGDNVVILSGDDKGKTGKVVKAFPRENKVVVEGVNMAKKHQRPRAEGQKGQVIEMAMPIAASKVAKKV
ncbi:MAG: 50S ribosomal protein L24 [Patescibacteria group bacterium]|nr:50S ribosomal protein L24 [Patescibacteria group bacterium]MDE1941304.1 50S ribosomal protein L24 [Patescibacteria group bacterium]MDE1966515.1 50S ribosomal protein L24 [Patescibacteria group bacterium]